LITEKEGRLCVQYYVRRDGTIVTNDCPVLLRAAMRAVTQALVCLLAVVGFLFGNRVSEACERAEEKGTTVLRQLEPFATVFEWCDPEPKLTFTRVGGGLYVTPLKCEDTSAIIVVDRP
jgi:hypothetical protein